MELQIISFWRPSKQTLLKFTKWDLWAFLENALLNNSVDLGAASYWSPNLISIPHVGFLGQLDTEAECCSDAKDGPCFSPLHRTGVELSAVANEPRMDHKPPEWCSVGCVPAWTLANTIPGTPAAQDKAEQCQSQRAAAPRVPPTEPRLRAPLDTQPRQGTNTPARSKNTGLHHWADVAKC